MLAQQPKHLAEPPSFQSASRGRSQDETALTGGNLRKLSACGADGQTNRRNHARRPACQGRGSVARSGHYPGGQQEHITGFETEADALDWIVNDSADWLEKRSGR